MPGKPRQKIVNSKEIMKMLYAESFHKDLPKKVGNAAFSFLFKKNLFRTFRNGHIGLHWSDEVTRGFFPDAARRIHDYLKKLNIPGRHSHQLFHLLIIRHPEHQFNLESAGAEDIENYIDAVQEELERLDFYDEEIYQEFGDDLKDECKTILKYSKSRLIEIIKECHNTISSKPNQQDEIDQPPVPSKLSIDKINFTATYEGVTHPLTEGQMNILIKLINAKGGYIPSNTLKTFKDSSERPDRIINRLPTPLRELIEGKPGAGFHLILPVE